MNKTETIGNFTLNYKYYSGQDVYSDGDVENYMLRICQDGEIDTALQSGKEWPILYHFSKVRENLLEWYPFTKESSLLEIGSGCGALTGLFCEKIDRVVCVELSKRRSMINAYKNQSRGKAEILVGNFQDIIIGEKFDYITLIGVLEYSKLYINDQFPFDKMLKRISSFLKPAGIVIIAIENKMGMKYLSGAAEDHTGHPFDGLNGYIKGESAVTFSKQAIEKLLYRNGFTHLKFYYPMPDYKLPSVIYSDQFLPKPGDVRGISKAYSGINYQFFSEEKAFDSVCEDGQFPYFANSFLIMAEKDERSNI